MKKNVHVCMRTRAGMHASGDGVSDCVRVSCHAPPRTPALDPPLASLSESLVNNVPDRILNTIAQAQNQDGNFDDPVTSLYDSITLTMSSSARIYSTHRNRKMETDVAFLRQWGINNRMLPFFGSGALTMFLSSNLALFWFDMYSGI